ncbi:MAG: phosphodiester glycosidase family protein [Ignavibacteriales bacterium]|nr:phosphodiester glycosidase family protein [Ignavibacteriales bacterium]
MKKNFIQLPILFFIMFSIQLFSQSKDTIIVHQILPGIIHKKIISVKDTIRVNVLEVDLSRGEYYIRSASAKNNIKGKATTSNVVNSFIDSSFQVVAAINGDFWEDDGEVVNNMICEGDFVKATKFTDSPFNDFVNSQFAITFNNKPMIEQFVFSGDVIFKNGLIEKINRINSKADSNSFTLYNHYQGKSTPKAPGNWKINELELNPFLKSGDTIFCKLGTYSLEGENKIENGKFILSANNRYTKYFKKLVGPGDIIKLVLHLNPNRVNVRSLVGGWPRLVCDGKNISSKADSLEGVFPRFSKTKHPRTGIGFSKDSTKLFLIAVDGRQESSSGMSLNQFANLMISQGVYQGLNFDGGGSTTMVIGGEVVNKPSDITGERPVGNCLLVVKRKAK